LEEKEFIYGLRPVIEALEAGKEIDKILIQNGLRSEMLPSLRQLLAEKSIPYQYVPLEKLNRVSRKNHQGVIAFISQVVYSDIENIVPFVFEKGETPLILLLDRITDVRNFGAVARSAECAGVHAIVIPLFNSVRVSADAVRSSAGALNRIPVCRVKSMIACIEYLRASGLQIIACTEKAEMLYHTCNLSAPAAIVMGSEEDGISEPILKIADQKISIPMQGRIASLNISVAAGIVLFEAVKQRTLSSEQ
jgi:23S rRNA (guanosine2251-2'-O)-methyltransferase